MTEADALQRLVDGLGEALEEYAGRNADPDDEDQDENFQRAGVVQALERVLDYLGEFNTQANLRTPLLALLGALADLERGKVQPLLEKAKLVSAPPAGIKEVHDLAMASAAVDWFRKDGDTLPEALRKVALHVGKTSDYLENWRKKLRQSKQRPEAQQFYDTVRREARTSGLAPGVAARRAVEFLKDKNPKA